MVNLLISYSSINIKRTNCQPTRDFSLSNIIDIDIDFYFGIQSKCTQVCTTDVSIEKDLIFSVFNF